MIEEIFPNSVKIPKISQSKRAEKIPEGTVPQNGAMCQNPGHLENYYFFFFAFIFLLCNVLYSKNRYYSELTFFL